MSKLVKLIRILSLTFLILALLLPLAQGAVIQGTVYDYNLEKIYGAQVVLGTEKTIAQNGQYKFFANTGTYTIEARKIDRSGKLIASTNDTIIVREDKEYILDLILFDVGKDGVNATNNANGLNGTAAENQSNNGTGQQANIADQKAVFWIKFSVYSILIIIVLALFFGIHFRKKIRHIERTSEEKIKQTEKKIEESIKQTEKKIEGKKEVKHDDLQKDAKEVLDFIKKNNGRTTQLEIRENFPSSEAKISLIITELEHKGRIQKIKKGRGNIILLK